MAIIILYVLTSKRTLNTDDSASDKVNALESLKCDQWANRKSMACLQMDLSPGITFHVLVDCEWIPLFFIYKSVSTPIYKHHKMLEIQRNFFNLSSY